MCGSCALWLYLTLLCGATVTSGNDKSYPVGPDSGHPTRHHRHHHHHKHNENVDGPAPRLEVSKYSVGLVQQHRQSAMNFSSSNHRREEKLKSYPFSHFYYQLNYDLSGFTVGSLVVEEPPYIATTWANGAETPWPVKREATMEGDLILGGLMMVHEREDSITCGPVMPQGGIQAVETMLYTLDEVNKHLKHFKIGAHILDDCDKDTYGLEMAVDFIKGE